MFLSRTKTLQV